MDQDFESLQREAAEALKKEESLKEAKAYKGHKVEMERDGTKIILPAMPHPMSIDHAVNVLNKIKKEDEAEIDVVEPIVAWPLDGAHAMMKAMRRMYGWATPVPTQTWFGPINPDMVQLETGYGQTAQVIWGNFTVPGIQGVLTTSHINQGGRTIFCIRANVKKKDSHLVKAIADETRQVLATESVYRGKAIALKTGNGGIDFDNQPQFLNTKVIKTDELVFSDEVMDQVQTNLFTPIQHTEVCRALKIPLKRGVLLGGPYGTGKTMAANVTAKICEDNGWTFIMLDKVAGLRDALIFARMYQPAVVFAEDIDRAITGERTVSMDDVLNTIDGLSSKNTEIICVLTSNHVDKINPAMLRPGRLDAVLNIAPPDEKAVGRLIHLYGRGLTAQGETFAQASQELNGQIPAVIREVVERSKLYAISRTGSNDIQLTDQDLLQAAKGMKQHLALLNVPKEVKLTDEHQLGETLSSIIGTACKEKALNGLSEMPTQLDVVERVTKKIARVVGA